MKKEFNYDIIIVGAGHAGCEAAAAAAKLGSRVILITMDMTKIAQMSCNPAIGGIAKGQIVREIDALGGFTGIATDKSTIQFRMLNKSKGPAMWSPRAQCDRMLFSANWRLYLESIPNIEFWQDIVTKLIINQNRIIGVKTKTGIDIFGSAVILSNGTFINGVMYVGDVKIQGGRASEPAASGISEQLKKHDFEIGRMKTGTSPRIDGRTIDFTKLEKQEGDIIPGRFSYLQESDCIKKQLPCYIAYTNSRVHKILESGFECSPLFKGKIEGVGPRYCPSIEDKIVTFPEKPRHQLFLEPEGRNTCEFYINGFSSSLPLEVQLSGLRKVKGLENVKIFRPGYAIEYDYYSPAQLKYSLETKFIENLFFAGQINGTTGYEEAAGQGIIAGINAHHKINNNAEFILNRNQAYIGVLIDDLINKGVDEPYRMFTSRAEFRLLLRQDNADERLTSLAGKIGLASEKRIKLWERKREYKERITNILYDYSVSPDKINGFLQQKSTAKIRQKTKLFQILLRPQISIYDLTDTNDVLREIAGSKNFFMREILENIEINLKYKGYIEREKNMAEKLKRLEHITIHPDYDYDKLSSISTEGREKLKKIKPQNLGQASRISGVSPADISALIIYFGR